MSNNNSNDFQTPPEEAPIKFELSPFGIEHPPNPPRPFYMVKSSKPIFPTLTRTGPINLFPFYVSTGTNFSREQSNKLSVFSGISFIYRENNGTPFIDLLNTFPLLKKLVLDYIDLKGGNKGKKNNRRIIAK